MHNILVISMNLNFFPVEFYPDVSRIHKVNVELIEDNIM